MRHEHQHEPEHDYENDHEHDHEHEHQRQHASYRISQRIERVALLLLVKERIGERPDKYSGIKKGHDTSGRLTRPPRNGVFDSKQRS